MFFFLNFFLWVLSYFYHFPFLNQATPKEISGYILPVGFWTEDSLNGTYRRYPIFKQFGFCRMKYKTVGCSQTSPFTKHGILEHCCVILCGSSETFLRFLCNPCSYRFFILLRPGVALRSTERSPHSLVPQAPAVSSWGCASLTGEKLGLFVVGQEVAKSGVLLCFGSHAPQPQP